MGLLPAKEKFFDMLDRAAKNVTEGVEEFQAMLADYGHREEHVKKLDALEHEGDIITHEIMDKLNRSFVTPIDREDIHALASGLDDVIDVVEEAAHRMHLYRIEKPNPRLLEQAEILLKAAQEVSKAVTSLRDLKRPRRILDYAIEINRLENEGDVALNRNVAALFEGQVAPLEVIKWKEIYEHVEAALDKCEDIAVIIEGVVVKNA